MTGGVIVFTEKKSYTIYSLRDDERHSSMNSKKSDSNKISPMLILLIVTAVAITATGIIFHQKIYRIVPLYVSLIIGILQSRANRYAALIGSGNALLYGAVNIHFKMYASAANAILVSSPFQLATFFKWNKKKYKSSTTFRRMTRKQRIFVAVGFVSTSALVYLLLSASDSKYRILDTFGSLLGLLVSVLTLLSYVEYTWFQLPSSVLSIVTNTVVALDHPEQITYVIYSVYTFLCMIVQCLTVRRLYDEQHGKTGQHPDISIIL